MHDDQPFPPWGTVTPAFWMAGQPEQLVEAAHVPQAREAGPVKAEEPQPTAAPAPQIRGEAGGKPETPRRSNADEQPEARTPAAVDANQVAAHTHGIAEQDGPPAEYRDRIKAITDAFGTPDDAARLATAAVEAERIDQEFVARYGQQHPNTISLRELRGWLAYLQGQMGVAARWYLHTTGLQVQVWGNGHQVTQGSVQRTVHIWLSIPDAQESFSIGQELLTMLAAVTGESSDLFRMVRSRLESMGAQGGA